MYHVCFINLEKSRDVFSPSPCDSDYLAGAGMGEGVFTRCQGAQNWKVNTEGLSWSRHEAQSKLDPRLSVWRVAEHGLKVWDIPRGGSSSFV